MQIPNLNDLKSKISFKHFKNWVLDRQETAQPVTETCLSCDFGRAKVVFLEIEKTPEGIKVLKFQKIPRPSGQGKDAEVLKDVFLKGGFVSNKVRISLKGHGVIVRFIQFPLMKPAELKSAIAFEIDQYIPFKVNEVVWDFYIADDNIQMGGKPMMNVMLVAVKQEELYATLQTFQAAELQVDLIDVDALASINTLEYFHPDTIAETVAILDIGSEVSTLGIVHHGKPKFIRDITYGGVDIIKKIKRKLTLTQEQAVEQIEVDRVPNPEVAEVIKEALGDLVSEIKVSLNYYLDQIPGAEAIKRIFMEGGGGYHPLVIEKLSVDLGIPVEMMNILEKVQLGEGVDPAVLKSNQGILAVPFGLCLRDL